MKHKKLEEALVEAISRIAQHACRMGESGGRNWPAIDTLPYRTSWKCVGETYARPVLAMLLTAGLNDDGERKAEEITPEEREAHHLKVVAERDALRVENARLRRALDTIGNPRRYARKVLAKGAPK